MTLRAGNRQAFGDRVGQVHYNNSDPIKTISNETLIIWGKYDEWIPVECAYKFEKDIPDSKLIIYEDCGHIPMEEKSIESGNDVKEFLSETPLRLTEK